MSFIKCMILIFCLCISLSANALKSTDTASEKYILDHGHSEELERMIELQKSRVEPDSPDHKTIKRDSRFAKFFKNIFYERDLTMPLEDFGQDRVRTPESPKR